MVNIYNILLALFFGLIGMLIGAIVYFIFEPENTTILRMAIYGGIGMFAGSILALIIDIRLYFR